jgi:hypothetical protein
MRASYACVCDGEVQFGSVSKLQLRTKPLAVRVYSQRTSVLFVRDVDLRNLPLPCAGGEHERRKVEHVFIYKKHD